MFRTAAECFVRTVAMPCCGKADLDALSQLPKSSAVAKSIENILFTRLMLTLAEQQRVSVALAENSSSVGMTR